jgi:hypothetical protein
MFSFSKHLALGPMLEHLRRYFGGYSLVEHWQQGEFHHDILLRVDGVRCGLPGSYLVAAINCNGGIKEIFCFDEAPSHAALWHRRCPDNAAFRGELPRLLAYERTVHFCDPCELLAENARSEFRPEFRERQAGGGFKLKARSAG